MPAAQAVASRALWIITFLLLSLAPLFAGGQGEERLQRVDELIEAKSYNQAFKLLNQVMIDNPDQWDLAQERMDTLLAIVDRKNQLEQRIYDAMTEDDVDAAFALLEELQEFDPEPNRDAEELISEIVFNIGIIRNDNLLRDLMDEVRPILDGGDRELALDRYLTGFEIGRDIFEDTEYGETLVDVVTTVESNLDAILGITERFDELKPVFEGLVASFELLVDAYDTGVDLAPLEATIASITPLIATLKANERRVEELNGSMQFLRERLRDDIESLEDIYYLSYIDTLVRGRDGSSETEGMLAALDIGLADTADRMIAEIRSLLDTEYERAVARYRDGAFEEAAESFSFIDDLEAVVIEASSLAAYRVNPGSGLTLDQDERQVATSMLETVAQSRARRESADRYLEVMAYLADSAGLDEPEPESSVSELEAYRGVILDSLAQAARQVERAREVDTGFETELAAYLTEVEQRLLDPLSEDLNKESRRLETLEGVVVGEIIDLEIAGIRERFAPEQAERLAEAERLLEGEDTGPGAGFTEEVTRHRFPSQADELLEITDEALTLLADETETVIESYASEPSYILESEPVSAALQSGETLRAEVDALDTAVAEANVRAEASIASAERLRGATRGSIDSGERLLEENDDRLEAEQYLNARDTIIPETLDTAVEALTVEWDREFRSEIESWAADFGNRIVEARFARLRQIAEQQLDEAKAYLAAVESDMQQEEFNTALERVDPVESARDDAVAFKPDREFEAEINREIADLEQAIYDARAAELRSLVDEAIATAESYYLNSQDDMIEERYREALGLLDPIRSEFDVAEEFQEDPEFASRVEAKLATLETDINRARAEELRRNTTEALADARDFYEAESEGMLESEFERAISLLDPVDQAFRIAQEFAEDEEFATSIEESVAALEEEIREARAQTLRDETDELLLAAREYLTGVESDMQAQEYDEARALVVPVQAAFDAAEQFKSDPAFASRMSRAISSIQTDIADARAEELRRVADEALARADSYYESVRNDMQSEDFDEALSLLDPVNQAYRTAQNFQEDQAFAERIEDAVATLDSNIREARATTLRREANERIAAAESVLEENRPEMTADRYRSTLAMIPPAEQKVEEAEQFSRSVSFLNQASTRLSAVASEAEASRAELLRGRTDEAIERAEEYLATNSPEMPREIYDTLDTYIGPVETALSEAETFLSDEEFRSGIQNRIEAVEQGFDDAHIAYLKGRTRDRLTEARSYLDQTRQNMSDTEYDTALANLQPVSDALEDALTFSEDPGFESEIETELALLDSDIRDVRATQLRDETLAFLDLAEESANAGVTAADRNQVSTATDEFASARSYLLQVSSLAGQADEVVEDSEFTGTVDNRIDVLEQRILDAEIAIVVREVRGMITNAQNAYSAGEYDLAYGYITEAETRYSDVSTEPDTEIEYWFNIINNARQTLSGREISESDPRYETVRPRLNAAQQYFEEGLELSEAGRETAAEDAFADASDELLSILALFPLNQEAGLLNLRIAKQMRSPAEYEQLLEDNFNKAIDQFDTETAESYALLTDLKEIEPNYPGLDERILEAEYRLGIRERPIDPAILARARQLVADARSIYDTYRTGAYDDVVRESQYKRALDLLDQALGLNPRLTTASTLKDEISTNVGSDARIALPSAAQRQYEEAYKLFVEENKAGEAFLITSQLMRDEANLGFKPLVELHQRLIAAVRG